MSSSRKFQIGVFIILLFHTVGLIGMNVGVCTPLFESVAWANILLSFGMLIWCHEFCFSQRREDAKRDLSQRHEDAEDIFSKSHEDAKQLNTTPKSPEGDFNSRSNNVFKPPLGGLGVALFIALTAILGFTAEVIGVRTGLLFGAYHYTSVFGWSLLSVPLIIGVNWTLLTYATGVLVSRISLTPLLKTITAAALMTASDVLLEGFAIKHHFWVWESGFPPIQNFVGWFVVSLIMQAIYQWLIPESRNRLAGFYLAVFVLFLVLDRLF